MSDPVDQGRRFKQPVGSPPDHSALAYMAPEPDSYNNYGQLSSSPRNGPLSAPASNAMHIPERPNIPTRSSTAPSPHDYDFRKPKPLESSHSRSEDFNHTSSSPINDPYPSDRAPGRSQGFLSASRPSTPASSNNHTQPSSSSHSLESSQRRNRSNTSDTDDSSESSATGIGAPTPSTSHTATSVGSS